MDGFLGTRASLMLDLVVLAMIAVIPVLTWSIWLVKVRKNYELHKWVQVVLGVLLFVTVLLFEIDVRFITGWRDRAMPSPYYATGVVQRLLAIHLAFAVSTAILWPIVLVRALRNFASSPQPGLHSAWHKRWCTFAAADLTATAISGWFFYWVAFVA